MTVEITFVWQDVVLDVVVRDETKPFVLGDGPGAYPIPTSLLGCRRQQLIAFDGDTPCVSTLCAAEPQHASAESAIRLKAGERLRLVLGSLVVLVERLAISERLPRTRPTLELRSIVSGCVVAAMHLAFLAWAAFSLPPTEDRTLRPRVEALQITADVAFDGQAIPEEAPVAAAYRDVVGARDQRNGVFEGEPQRSAKRLGEPTAKRVRHRRAAVQGPRDNPDPHIARQHAEREACWDCWFGWDRQGLAGDPYAPIIASGRDTSLGLDDQSSRAPNWIRGKVGVDHGESRTPPRLLPGQLKKVLTFVGAQAMTAENR